MNSFQGRRKFFDLSHPVSPKMQTFPVAWHKPVEFEELGKIEVEGRRTTHIHIGTHSGTHFDAPSHFIKSGNTISDFPISTFHLAALLVDCRDIREMEEVSEEDLRVRFPSQLPADLAILLDFDWSRNYGTSNYYKKQPFLSDAAVSFLLSFSPRIIGYDLAMPDDPRNGRGTICDSPMHKKILGANVLLLENLVLHHKLPQFFDLIAYPLNLEGLDGAPVRVVGEVNE